MTEQKASILDMVQPTISRAPRITIYGKAGIGKSTLASKFPSPLFLLTEDNELPNIKALPIFTSCRAFIDALKELLTIENLPYKTIVIDSISKLDHLVVSGTITQSCNEGKRCTTLISAFGGYGAGYEKAAQNHRAIKHLLDKFKEKDIAVVYIAHSEIKKIKSPENDDYDMITINMHSDKARSVYTDDVDAVFYCKLDAEERENDSGRTIIKNNGKRIIMTSVSDTYATKNRFAGMPNAIPMDFESIKKYVGFYK